MENMNKKDGFQELEMMMMKKKIDLKKMDEQLDQIWSMKKSIEPCGSGFATFSSVPMIGIGMGLRKQKQDWEIDPSILLIKAILARGSFRTVHRGTYHGRDVAVKLLDWGEEGQRTEAEISSLRSAFLKEVIVWHKLDHPNVTNFIGATMGASGLLLQNEKGQIAMPNNICCVVAEYLQGGDLKSYLIKHSAKKLPLKIVIQLALDLAKGLSYIHMKNIVHRDVKTENILLDKTGTVKITDFGEARFESSNPSSMTGVTGTLGYMAPEVLNGKPYDRKCDVYTFGICLWEIYCCEMPFPGLSFSDVTSGVACQDMRPEIPRCCPSAVASVMRRCWDELPEKRPEMVEVVSMLEAINTSRGGGMIPEGQHQGCLGFLRRRGP